MAISCYFQRLPETRLAQVLRNEAAVEDTVDELSQTDELNLEIVRSWQLIHFLLTGAPWERVGPFANAVLGGSEISGTDSGYGAYRFNAAKDAQALCGQLDELSFDMLWSRFDLARVQAGQIYPEDWTGSDGDRQACQNDYEALQAFLASAAQGNEAVLMFLS
ncbi:YfbM family protein [Variovorax paradoxus]|uniref:YfbM family protein n=1 Tax=Variovorax paradoxus TaxID=34073 RepID=UPI003D65EE12